MLLGFMDICRKRLLINYCILSLLEVSYSDARIELIRIEIYFENQFVFVFLKFVLCSGPRNHFVLYWNIVRMLQRHPHCLLGNAINVVLSIGCEGPRNLTKTNLTQTK